MTQRRGSPSPEISIMMPTFNSVQYVDAAILSVLSQDYSDWELLAYDDNSDDGTYERLQFWAGQDERISAVRPFSSHGEYVNLCNQMISDARGSLLARLDADDLFLPARLGMGVAFLVPRPSVTLVASMALCIIENADGNRVTGDYPWLEKVVRPAASTVVPANERLRAFNCVVNSSILIRKSDVTGIGGYDDLVPLEDWDLALKLASKGEIYILPNILTLKRQHANNSSQHHPNLQSAFDIVRQRHNLCLDRLPRAAEM